MIKFEVLKSNISDTDILVIPVFNNNEIYYNSIVNNLIEISKKFIDLEGFFGDINTIFYPNGDSIKKLVIFNLGDFNKINLERLRIFSGKIFNYCIDNCIGNNLETVKYVIPSTDVFKTLDSKSVFISLMEGVFLANDFSTSYKSIKKRNPLLKVNFNLTNTDDLKFSSLLYKVQTICNGTILARKWTNMPSNYKTPSLFSVIIKKTTKKYNLKTNILKEEVLLSEGLNGLLAVGQGSDNESCLVTMDYNPIKSDKTILIVGKGVTFDSGGINIKPDNGLKDMKTDMSGASVVAGTLLAISKLKYNIRLIGLLPLVENMPSGTSMRPGDIIQTYSGKTVEILNTDAEGRLILADSIAWGIDKYKPDYVIDIATLTGACLVALGDKIAGIFSNDDSLSDIIFMAGNRTYERCWRMPLPDDYYELLKSDFADLSNISSSKWGGAITAAAFLSEFVKNTKWAHIDIAGTARNNKKNDYCPIGATGFGVRLLCEVISKLQ